METGALEWLNEHALTDYPLTGYAGVYDFLLDANFVQFDGFVPILVQGEVKQDSLVLDIQFDRSLVQLTLLQNSVLPESSVRVYEADTSRYLGCLVFGSGIYSLFQNSIGTVFSWNLPFCASTVIPVNSRNGVYSIDKVSGDLNISTGIDKNHRTIFFGVDVPNKTVIWNAVGLDEIKDVNVALKTLNGVRPINNTVIVGGSELIKVTPGSGSLSFGVAAAGTNVITSQSFS